MAGAVIMKTATKEYVSGWTPLGIPRLTKNIKDAERMLKTAANRVAENLNESEHSDSFEAVGV